MDDTPGRWLPLNDSATSMTATSDNGGLATRNPSGPFHAPPPVPPISVERVLGRVRKPGRYAGGEWNSVAKEWSEVALKWCFAYPDLYEIGMSNLGLRILYEVVNDRPDLLADQEYREPDQLESGIARVQ